MAKRPSNLDSLTAETAQIIGRAFLAASPTHPNAEIVNAFRIVCREMSKHMTEEQRDQVQAMTMLDVRDPYFPKPA